MVTTPASLLVHAVSDSGINYSWHFSSGFWAKSFHRQAKKAGFHAPPQFKFPRWRQKPSICVTFLPALHWIVLISSWSSRKESNTKWSWSLKYNHCVSSPRPKVRNCEIWAVTCFYSEILLFQAFVALLYVRARGWFIDEGIEKVAEWVGFISWLILMDIVGQSGWRG